MSALLAVVGLSVAYGSGVLAVRDATLSVSHGEFVALLGANGAGKTTLLRALSGLLSHHNGRVVGGRASVAGHDLLRAPGHARARLGIAQTFEGRRILRDFSVEENLRAGGLSSPAAEVAGRMEGLYGRFPILAERRRRPAGLLSGGEQQILAIARALMSDPKLLLLDEPTLGLAPIMIAEVAKTLREIQALGKTVLLVEQNAHLALQLADRAYIMQNGATVAEGTAEALKTQEVMRHFYLGIGEGSLPIRQRAAVRMTA